MAIMNPKWANIPARQYQLGEAANFIMFTNRQRDRQKFQKVLSFNKNAPGLVSSAGQKHGKNETHKLDALGTIFTDAFTQAVVTAGRARRVAQMEKRHAKALARFAAFAHNSTAQNLRLGEAGRVGTDNIDGVLCKAQLAEPLESARPVPPYPFAAINLPLTRDTPYISHLLQGTSAGCTPPHR
mmetsp:Transcript_18670/g.41698  ORF Transcript_18670/g.41698 Transcript_18670/m.41698 type:complete len:184 (+) Transcript_18670:2193-2744(+)